MGKLKTVSVSAVEDLAAMMYGAFVQAQKTSIRKGMPNWQEVPQGDPCCDLFIRRSSKS